MQYNKFIDKLNHSYKTNQSVFILETIMINEDYEYYEYEYHDIRFELVESVIISIQDDHIKLERSDDGFIEHYGTTELYNLIKNSQMSFEQFFNGDYTTILLRIQK
jgi:hypothetical protein